MRAVGRIDIHQHEACARAGILQQDPLRAVGRPDAHTILRSANAIPPDREPLGSRHRRIAPRVAQVLVTRHQRFALGKALRGPRQSLGKRHFD